MSLLDDVRAVVSAGTAPETPTNTEILQVVGGLLKVLEVAGIKVADELINPPAAVEQAPAAAPSTGQAAAADSVTESRLSKIEAALSAIAEKLVPGGSS